MNTETDTITLQLELTEGDAIHLCGMRVAKKPFYDKHSEEFETVMGGDPTDSRSDGGHFAWCATYCDALLLRAFEMACGYDAMILWDLLHAEGPQHSWVVLTTRSIPSR